VLGAALAVPWILGWRTELRALPRPPRQMRWVYGVYIALAIAAQGLASVVFAGDLSRDGALPRAICGYFALFWGLRLALQAVFDVKSFSRALWLRAANTALTSLFLALVLIYGWVAFRP
jgi:hypothetical protein